MLFKYSGNVWLHIRLYNHDLTVILREVDGWETTELADPRLSE